MNSCLSLLARQTRQAGLTWRSSASPSTSFYSTFTAAKSFHTPISSFAKTQGRYSATAAAVKSLPLIADSDVTLKDNGIILRPYQKECLDSIQQALNRRVSRIGVSSPTGSGKTTIFGELIEAIPSPSPTCHRVLILVSSIQLAQQAANHISRRYPDLWVEIEQGTKYKASGYADVTVATWQTLISVERSASDDATFMERMRLEKFDPSGYKAIIVDEAHHAASKSWRRVLNHFDSRIWVEGMDTDTQSDSSSSSSVHSVPIIGFSATFSRHDGLSLGSVFEEIVFHKDILDLIDEEWLSPLRFTSIQAQIPLDTVSIASEGSDFNTASLARVINTTPINKLIVRSWLSRTQVDGVEKRSRTLIFAVNIQHVKDLTQTFREAGIDARFLTGKTQISERKELLSDFADGVYPVLVNCAILTEGADIPSIDCVLLARPTLSRNLFSQMIGRGMRLSPQTEKKDCLILDLVGNCSKGLICTPTLFGLDPSESFEDVTSEDLLQRRGDEAEEKLTRPHLEMKVGDPTKLTFIDYDSAKALHQAMKSKVLFHNTAEKYSSNSWTDCGGDIYVIDIPPSRGYIRIERQVDAELQKETYVAQYTPKNADEDEARAVNPFSRKGRRTSPYRRPRRVLEAETLEQAIRGSDTYISTQIFRSSQLMRALLSRHADWRKAPASSKQRAFVEKRLGFDRKKNEDKPGETKEALVGLTKGEASMILTRLTHGAKGRWQNEAKRQNKIWEKEEQIRERRQRETVQVGKL